MRMLITVHYFAPHVGGMEEVAKKQAESLVGFGDDVTVVTCRPDPASPLDERIDGYRVKRLKALNFIENKFGVTYPLISPFYFFSMVRMMKNTDAVHIHDVFYMSSHLVALAAIFTKTPFYLTQHVALVDHPSRLVMLVQKLVYGSFGKLLFRRAEKIVCYNTNVRDFLISNGVPSSKALLNYNGIDVAVFAPVTESHKVELRTKLKLPLDKTIALFVGRLVPKKGFDIVYEAASDDYLTLIVGPGEIPASMRTNANVMFLGSADQAQLKDLYAASDIFVFPAIGEILTLVMQEAMASGLPVITTDDPAYVSYDLDENLIMFTKRNASDMRQSIAKLVDDSSLRKRMSDYSRELAVERFSWETNYAKEYSIYTQGAAA